MYTAFGNRRWIAVAALLAGALAPCAGAADRKPEATQLAGGRRFQFVRSIDSEKDVSSRRGFWTKFVDVVAGAPKFRRMVRPYGVTTTSNGAMVVSDPGAEVVHVFDFDSKKYHL